MFWTIVGWIILIIAAIVFIADFFDKDGSKNKASIVVSIAMIILGGYLAGHTHRVNVVKQRALQYDRIGYPINHKKMQSYKSLYYYSKDDTEPIEQYYVNGKNKKISAVEFDEAKAGAFDSKKDVIKNFKKVTSNDLEHTNGNKYYSKKEHMHYWTSMDFNPDAGGYGDYVIHESIHK